ncbi:MAG TPA: hypothetical protein PKC65_04650 [Pyrinomonadaceae bacterium]|jgi:hypothetical protein|nr:hypothetical protein [Pyrinomonadaceae bacterium]
MRKTAIILALGILVSLSLAGCSGSNLTAVSLTSPWDKMNLPIGKSDIIHKSNDKELGIVVYNPPASLFESYRNAIEANGWKRTNVGSTGDIVDFEKDGKKMNFMYFNNSDEGYYSISFVID